MNDPPENAGYLTTQLITYIGNKRRLLGFIGTALEKVKARLGKKRLVLFDLFSGSGVVSRFFKRHAELLLVNDIEAYAEVISRCYLANREELDLQRLRQIHGELTARLEEGPLEEGFVSELYAPRDEEEIRDGERVFYTPRNARFLDTACRLIRELEGPLRPFFQAPLLAEASVHANTAGVFKGFYKDVRTGRGRFGGGGANALKRILGRIELPFPVFSNFCCPALIFRGDVNLVAGEAPEADLAYLDPPYNQHPYGSNYFMLNLLVNYERPQAISAVSGIPQNWNHSDYNRKMKAADTLANLVSSVKAKYLLISFNSEGFISPEDMTAMLAKAGAVEILETPYNTFRGSRNLRNRRLQVKEYLFLVEKY
ncbi:MAG: DNA adenine methylase [Treponema sp.]|jgi:adenine-specific DNA-methyltransferase|nr:DNA adenine methylase [Treponema sp.]